VERFNLRQLNELEVRKQNQIKILKRLPALENLSYSEDINRAWENIEENNKTSAKESLGRCKLQQHKPWFDEECSQSLDNKKLQANM
jgi:hypothetical protein